MTPDRHPATGRIPAGLRAGPAHVAQGMERRFPNRASQDRTRRHRLREVKTVALAGAHGGGPGRSARPVPVDCARCVGEGGNQVAHGAARRWTVTRPSVFRTGGAMAVVALVTLLASAACAPPTSPYSQVPVYVTSLSGATQISAGPESACALVAGGTVTCWGAAYPPAGSSPVPVTVAGVSGATQVSAGYGHACAVVVGGMLRCWGNNSVGQLGNGTTSANSVPVDVTGVSGATQVAAGEGHSCAVVSGAVKCWGRDDDGELGNGTTGGFSATPVDVTGLSGVTQVVADGQSSCALLAAGAVKCWGANNVGQLGDGTTTGSPTPVDVTGVSGATQITTSGGTACALVAGGAVKCWGSNQVGNLGNGALNNDPNPTPVDVVGLSGATWVDAGTAETCAVVAGGAVKCWGSNIYGSLGAWTPTYWSGTPVGVFGIVGATQVSGGRNNVCALLAAGAAKCWGSDFAGELGNG